MLNTQYKTLMALKNNLPYYAKHCLKIKTKTGEITPFVFNKAQLYIHRRLEEQKRKTGRVRAVIVKGRQQGASTYISGRFFHRVTLNPGTSAFILSHMSDATTHLFEMSKRYYDNAPSVIVPKIEKANERRLVFAGIDSGYGVGTAGSENIGRSMTVQLFHGSEVAFWENTDGITTGILQAIPDVPGTEIVFESTAKGVGNMFHTLAMNGIGEHPEGDFITIFTPWFWQDEYSKTLPPGFEMTQDEEELVESYGLTKEQIYWRRRKIVDTFNGNVWKFKQEYPCSVQEAFVTSGLDDLLTSKSARRILLTLAFADTGKANVSIRASNTSGLLPNDFFMSFFGASANNPREPDSFNGGTESISK